MQIGERDQRWQRPGPVMRSAGRGPAWIGTAALVVGLWVATGATPATAESSSQCRRLCRRDASGCTVEVARCRAQATTAFRDGSATCLSDVPARASGASPTSSLHGALRACRWAYRSCKRVAIKDCERSAREPLIAEHADSSTCPATPRPSCTEIGPDDECRDLLHPADRFFWDTLRAGTYGAIPDVLERLQAALAGCPGNPSLTRHVAVGCSPMTPYRYFRDKDETSRSSGRRRSGVSHTIRRPWRPRLRIRSRGSTFSPDAYVRFALADPEAYQVMFKLHQDTTSGQPELLAEGEGAWRPIRRATRDAIDTGALAGDTDSVAQLVWVGLDGLVIPNLAGKPKLGRSVEEPLTAMKATLLAGNFSARRAGEEYR
jgi:Tetracyclin repressor-like, C-terminal domain